MDQFHLASSASALGDEAANHVMVVQQESVVGEEISHLAQSLMASSSDVYTTQVVSAADTSWPSEVVYLLNSATERSNTNVVPPDASDASISTNSSWIPVSSDSVVVQESVASVGGSSSVCTGSNQDEVHDALTSVGFETSMHAAPLPSELVNADVENAVPVPSRMCTRSRARGKNGPRVHYTASGIVKHEHQASVGDQGLAAATEVESEPVASVPQHGVQAEMVKAMHMGHEEVLMAEARSLFEQNKMLDVTLTCTGVDGAEGRLQAHSLVLVSFSRLLHATLTAQSDGCQQQELSLHHLGVDLDSLSALVGFMYTGRMDVMAATKASLVKTAEALDIPLALEELKKHHFNDVVSQGKVGDENAPAKKQSKHRKTSKCSRAAKAKKDKTSLLKAEECQVKEEEANSEEPEADLSEKNHSGEAESEEKERNEELTFLIETLTAGSTDPDAADVEDDGLENISPKEEDVTSASQPRRKTRPSEALRPLKQADGSYTCCHSGCTFSAKSVQNMTRHLLTQHSERRPFKCEECGKAFKLQKYLIEHMRTHSDERPYACKVCGARFRAAKHRNRHQNIHSVVKPSFPCGQCEKVFRLEATLAKHVSVVHNREKPFKCQVEGCSYAAASSTAVRSHYTAKHEPEAREPILCEVCGRAFRTKQSMQCHVMASHEDVIFQCPHCPYQSRFKTGMASHVKRKHGLTLEGQVASPRFQCDRCQYACFTRHEFQRHTMNHRGEKPFKCPHCPYATVEKMNLKFHLRVHTGEKPHECTICHRKFPRTLGLRRHMLVHTGDKPHKCQECGAAYADKKSLESHRYSAHLQIKPFACSICSYACIRRENLSKHLRRVHGLREVNIQPQESLFAVKQEAQGSLQQLTPLEPVPPAPVEPAPSASVMEAAGGQLQAVYANQLGSLVYGLTTDAAAMEVQTVHMVSQDQSHLPS